MSTIDIDADDLALALEDATSHIVVPSVHEHEPIDIGTYRDKLRQVLTCV